MSHPNEDLIRRGYEAFSNGDLDTLREVFADDILWHAPGRNPLAGDYKGMEEVFGFFASVAEMTGGTFSLEIHDVLANDEHAVVLAVARGARDGKRFEDRAVHVWHVEGGKAKEFWGHPGDQYAVDEFWS